MPKRRYRVFVSHASDDLWVAEQIAESIDSCGAATFLDRRDIAAGDNLKQRIRDEMPSCDEILALFTPWSRHRAWVRHEIGMADALGKRTVCVLYKVSITDLDAEQDGRGPLDDLNFVDIKRLGDVFQGVEEASEVGMPNVFLSHSHRDTEIAAGIARELRRLGIELFDVDSIAAGQEWRHTITEAVRSADAFVLVVGAPEVASSSWVGYELGMAEAWHKPILILLSHNRTPGELPPDMSELPVVAFDPAQPERAAREIVDRLLAAA